MIAEYIATLGGLAAGLLFGYVWGHDTGYHDRIHDENSAILRARIERAEAEARS
ncbi:hypothetical protein CPT_Paku_015 [Burkholderia phage Paku]|uniref:Uncharacterized protein n=1 Tax=Burkholderia phage Paku TaxID=2859650 RepID=A0AAE7WN73_9CAUD|nr:hypothetical protein CPT_Paku_015 [Burkholderia phage Paku]